MRLASSAVSALEVSCDRRVGGRRRGCQALSAATNLDDSGPAEVMLLLRVAPACAKRQAVIRA